MVAVFDTSSAWAFSFFLFVYFPLFKEKETENCFSEYRASTFTGLCLAEHFEHP